MSRLHTHISCCRCSDGSLGRRAVCLPRFSRLGLVEHRQNAVALWLVAHQSPQCYEKYGQTVRTMHFSNGKMSESRVRSDSWPFTTATSIGPSGLSLALPDTLVSRMNINYMVKTTYLSTASLLNSSQTSSLPARRLTMHRLLSKCMRLRRSSPSQLKALHQSKAAIDLSLNTLPTTAARPSTSLLPSRLSKSCRHHEPPAHLNGSYLIL